MYSIFLQDQGKHGKVFLHVNWPVKVYVLQNLLGKFKLVMETDIGILI